MPIFLLH